jgi:pimeloyl-ACP methyl ester carboxylesterase
MRFTATAVVLVFAASLPDACAQALARRGDLGASLMPPAEGHGPRIVRLRAGSVLGQAGLEAGDELAAIETSRPARSGGDPRVDANAFGALVRAARAGDRVTVRVKRDGGPGAVTVTLPAMRHEAIEGVDLAYGEAASAKGYRVRLYTSRPRGATGRLPLVVFIPWLSCSPVENPLDAYDGWSRMLRDVMRDGGAQVVRVEKPGVGDSEGPDCSRSDLEDDLAAFRAGIRAALDDPGADPARLYLFGGSVGGALAPVLAREFAPRGLVVAGGFARTWLEHMLDIERRRLALSGSTPAEVNAAMRAFPGFYHQVLDRGATPAQAIAANPQWKAIWYDEPARQYGRRMRYYQQLQALDVESAWQQVAVPTLVLWGEYDWIMGREESDRAVAILRARDPALATYEVRRGMNHHFDIYPDAGAAFREEGGRYDAGAAQAIVRWLKAR